MTKPFPRTKIFRTENFIDKIKFNYVTRITFNLIALLSRYERNTENKHNDKQM